VANRIGPRIVATMVSFRAFGGLRSNTALCGVCTSAPSWRNRFVIDRTDLLSRIGQLSRIASPGWPYAGFSKQITIARI